MEKSPVTCCWTSCPVTSPCCIAGSHRLEPPSEGTAAEDVLAPLAAENGVWTPSVDKRRNRSWSWNPYGSSPSPWMKSAETSTYYCKTLWKRGRLTRFYLEFYSMPAMFVFLASTQRLAEAQELSSWRQFRQSSRRFLKRLKEDGEEWLGSVKLWRSDIHLIEGERKELHPQHQLRLSGRWWNVYQTLPPALRSTGMFGTGIQSYFSFLRFLVMLNLIIFLLMFSCVMLPIIVAPHASGNISYNLNDGEEIFYSLY